VVLYAGYLLMLWNWRQPWQYTETVDARTQLYFNDYSPDGTRIISVDEFHHSISIYENSAGSPGRVLAYLEYAKELLSAPQFRSDGTIWAIAAIRDSNNTVMSTNPRRAFVFVRRFPEWWWGHFYRPEVWFFPLLLGAVIWSIRKDRAVKA